MNVTALDASVGTFWTIWPDGEPRPDASSLNPAPGQPPTPNAVTTPLSGQGEFNVFNSMGTVAGFFDIDGYYTKSNLQTIVAELQRLDAEQAFVVEGTFITGIAGGNWTEIANVAINAPANGHVSVIADGTISESTDGQNVFCGISESAAIPPRTLQWQSPATGNSSPFSTTEVFSYAVGVTRTFSLMCFNANAGTSVISFPEVKALFTPAP